MQRLLLIISILLTLTNFPVFSDWELRNKEIGISALGALPLDYIKENGKMIYADGTNLYYSTDLGITWLKDTNNLTKQAISIVRKDSTIILSCNKLISVVRSTDMGKTWHSRIEGFGSGDSSRMIQSVLAIKDSFVFVGAFGFGIFRSSINGNDDWIRKNNFVGLESWKKIIPKTILTIGDKIFVGCNNNGIWVSTDNGESWYSRNNGLSFSAVFDLQYFDGFMYAGTFGGGVCRSSNFGETWERITPEEILNLSRILRVYAEGNVIITSSADNSGNFISKDFGGSWFLEPYCLQKKLKNQMCSLLKLDEYLYAMFYYHGFYRIKWDNLITSISDNGINNNIFPNPARSTTHISLLQEGDITFTAVDVLGRSFPLWSGYASAGDMELDVSSLPAGTFTLLINYGIKVEAVRLIKN